MQLNHRLAQHIRWFHRSGTRTQGSLVQRVVLHAVNQNLNDCRWQSYLNETVAKRLRDCAVNCSDFAGTRANTLHSTAAIPPPQCALLKAPPFAQGRLWGAPAPQQPTRINDHFPFLESGCVGAGRFSEVIHDHQRLAEEYLPQRRILPLNGQAGEGMSCLLKITDSGNQCGKRGYRQNRVGF